jgi:undecaprenyl-diphosphatase
MNTRVKITIAFAVFLILECILYFMLDKPIALYFSIAEITHASFIDFFRKITDLGKSIWYLWPCGVLTILCSFLSRGKDVPPHYRRLFAYVGVRTLFLFATIALSGIAADIIKPLIGRARPPVWLHDAIYGFAPLTFHAAWNSMPSGHTTTAFALAGSLCVFYPRLRFLWLAYALMLGASRVIVDAHYLSDVLAGALLGWITVRLFLKYGMYRIWKALFPVESLLPLK